MPLLRLRPPTAPLQSPKAKKNRTSCPADPKCCIIPLTDQHLALPCSVQILTPGGCTQPPVSLSSLSMDRVCIFIDGSNFYHALKAAELPVGVDLGKLGTELTGPDRRHIHTYYYNAPLRPHSREDSR